MPDAHPPDPHLFAHRSRLLLRVPPAAGPLVLLLACVLSSPALAAAGAIEYRITTDPGLRDLTVDMCIASPPASARLRVPGALRKTISGIVAIAADGSEHPLASGANTIELPREPFTCIRYDVALPRDARNTRHADVHWHGDAALIALNRILLRPAWQQSWSNSRLRFDLPDSIAVAAPGRKPDPTAAQPEFVLQDRPHTWHGDIALGKLANTELDVRGTRMRVSIVGGADARKVALLNDWIETGANAVAGLYGRFPVSDVQVFVVPLAAGPDPVPWGEVVRGGGDVVHLYVDGSRSLDELNANWVLCHELSHLLHPYVSADGSWLPEGIATYYQNVLRARAGMLEPANAWRKLASGFSRGRQQTSGERSLVDSTAALMRAGQYMRVYWSGAAIALLADVELRQLTGGVMSLDRVLDELANCCLPASKRWRPDALLRKMDTIAGTGTFMRLYERYVNNPVFPDVESTFEALGLGSRRPPGGSAAARSAAALRRAIMGAE